MLWKKRIYLDAAAGESANPSSPHEEGRRAKATLEEARTKIARLLEVRSDDIVFTAGATEANALAILGHARALRAAGREGFRILYLPSAHASIVENAKLAAELYDARLTPLPIKDARVDIEAMKGLITPETALVAMEAVCGETGVVWNSLEVRRALDAARPSGEHIMLHVDASQAPRTEKMARAHFGADTLALDASKISSVRGIGALVAHRTIPLAPLYEGGGQERGLRSGSEAPELVREFADALLRCAKGREEFRASSEKLRALIADFMMSTDSDFYIEEGKTQAPHIFTVSLPGRDTDYLAALLDEEGFAVSTRSACETDSEEGSRAVFALTGSALRARSTLRISWGPEMKAAHINGFLEAFRRSLSFIDSKTS